MFSIMLNKLNEENHSKEFLIKDKKWVELTPAELATHFLLRPFV